MLKKDLYTLATFTEHIHVNIMQTNSSRVNGPFQTKFSQE